MAAQLKLIHTPEGADEQIEIDGDDTIEMLLKDLAAGELRDELAHRAVVCIRELVQQRNVATKHLRVSVLLLNETLAKLNMLRERMGRSLTQ